jgi:DNA-binding NarL/FixJ family response regulator
VRVVIAEDSLLLREGIARVLESSGLEVVGLAGDLDSLMQAVNEHKPDVAITDIRMPPTHSDEGLQAAHRIRQDLPKTGVLVLSQYLDEDYVFKLLGNGAQGLGYLLKDRITDGDAFVDAVRRVAAGDAALDPEVVAHLLGRGAAGGPLGELNERERAVLGEMAEGRSNQAIASRLFLSDRAVERHVTAIFSKLKLAATPDSHRRVLAVLTYLRANGT